MADEQKELKSPSASTWVQLIDKLTDPFEMAINKIFSARFLMSVIVTVAACMITWMVIDKHPEHAAQVITGFMTTWMAIVKDYFAFKDKKDGQP